MSTSDLLALLKATPFFSELDPAILGDISSCIKVQNFPAQTSILKEGEPNNKLYFLIDGTAGVFVRGLKVANLNRKGDVVGEMSLVSDGLCSATVTSEAEMQMMVFSIEELRTKSKKAFDQLQQSQYRLLSASLVTKLIETNEKARQVEVLNAELEKKVESRTLELKQKNDILEKTLQENHSLVRILCHDLVNAITIADGSAQRALAQENIDPAMNRKLWERVNKATKKETEIITFVRNMIAIESGKIALELKPVSLREVVEHAKFIFQDRLVEKNVTLVDKISENSIAIAEPLTLSNSVFNNLISNALKFSQPGGSIQIEEQGKTENTITITVTDQGIGIPADILADLFSPDKKTSRTGTSGEVGTGFGMPLVKTYVEAYGGSIRVETICIDTKKSNEQSGTKMILEFKIK